MSRSRRRHHNQASEAHHPARARTPGRLERTFPPQPWVTGGNVVWRLWKRGTAWFGDEWIVWVNEAMDRKTRSTRPWRYAIWVSAWPVALVAYLPVGVLVALAAGSASWLTGVPQAVVVYGPIVAIGASWFYCIVRSWIAQTPVPPRPWDPGRYTPEAIAQRTRSIKVWSLLGGILTALSIVGRVLFH